MTIFSESYPDAKSCLCCLLGVNEISSSNVLKNFELSGVTKPCQWLSPVQRLLADLHSHFKSDLSEGPFGFDISLFFRVWFSLHGWKVYLLVIRNAIQADSSVRRFQVKIFVLLGAVKSRQIRC
jgi:hypothetical protein